MILSSSTPWLLAMAGPTSNRFSSLGQSPLPSTSRILMPVEALGHLVAQCEARIAHFIKVMTWTDQPNFQFHRENNNICPTCILTNRTTTLLPALQVIWRSFQINAIVRFRTVPSLEHLTEYEWIARELVVMAEAKAQCGHNPWKGIEKKIPRILETVAPVS